MQDIAQMINDLLMASGLNNIVAGFQVTTEGAAGVRIWLTREVVDTRVFV